MVGDIERPYRAAYQLFGIAVAVERDGGVGADTLELEEVAAPLALVAVECLAIYCRAVEIAMAELAVAVVVVEIMGEVDGCSDKIATN